LGPKKFGLTLFATPKKYAVGLIKNPHLVALAAAKFAV
jgi:hypothetical protein